MLYDINYNQTNFKQFISELLHNQECIWRIGDGAFPLRHAPVKPVAERARSTTLGLTPGPAGLRHLP